MDIWWQMKWRMTLLVSWTVSPKAARQTFNTIYLLVGNNIDIHQCTHNETKRSKTKESVSIGVYHRGWTILQSLRMNISSIITANLKPSSSPRMSRLQCLDNEPSFFTCSWPGDSELLSINSLRMIRPRRATVVRCFYMPNSFQPEVNHLHLDHIGVWTAWKLHWKTWLLLIKSQTYSLFWNPESPRGSWNFCTSLSVAETWAYILGSVVTQVGHKKLC